MTPELIAKVLIAIKNLDPTISTKYTDAQIIVFIDIANAIIDDSIAEDKVVLCLALITLDLLSTPETSNSTGKSIGAVSISYSSKVGTSKWRTMYEALLNGTLISDNSIMYVGI